MTKVIEGKKYDTDTAQLIAHDHFWDGSNWERHGRNQYLYRTKKGAFFQVSETCWQGERDELIAVGVEEAKRIYEELPELELDYAEAFGVEPVEA